MQVETHLPNELLRPYIQRYLIITSENILTNRVLPDASLVMAFTFRGSIAYSEGGSEKKLSSVVISGLRKVGRNMHYHNNTENILVIFREGAASAFLREPLHDLAGESLPLQYFSGYQNSSEILEQLAQMNNNAERIALIEKYLLSKLLNPITDQLIFSAIDTIKQKNGNLKMHALASQLYMSQDAFEKRFRKTVGLPPKQFAFVVRMRSIIDKISPGIPLSELALDAGYFDQPHFNKDFKLFTGQSPTDFQKSPVFW